MRSTNSWRSPSRTNRRRRRRCTRFSHEIEAADFAIKRDMEGDGDSVRVMTVHAAKGLEAPIVFLPDTCSAPHSRNEAKLIDLGRADAGDPAAFRLGDEKGRATRRRSRAPARGRARPRAGEHRRLLYVAMTRAAQRLVVAGYEGVRARPPDNWHDLVRSRPRRRSPARAGAVGRRRDDLAARREFERRGRRRRSPPQPPRQREPGVAFRRRSPRNGAAAAQSLARRRSRSLGRSEPRAPPGGLARSRPAATSAGHPHRAAPAGRGALSGVAGRRADARTTQRARRERAGDARAPRTRALVRRRDRAPKWRWRALCPGAGGPLCRSPDGSTASPSARTPCTSPTSRAARRPAATNPPAYVAQLALYRAALAPLYPDRPVRAFLVWLGAAEAVEIPPAELDEALSKLMIDA